MFVGAHVRCFLSIHAQQLCEAADNLLVLSSAHARIYIVHRHVHSHKNVVYMLVLTKAEQLCGNIGKLLETVEEAVGDQGAFLSSLLCSFCQAASLDENWRDWEGGAGGVDAQ